MVNHWHEIKSAPWVEQCIAWEESHRLSRSLDNRLRAARIGSFKPLAHFDWHWPRHCDRHAIEQWMQLDFIQENSNLILCGPNGVGKTMIARNIAYHAVVKGFSALFTTAASMLNELAAIDSESALRRRLKYYTKPALLVMDEVGYLSYGNRHADLLFEIISQRYEKKSTFITTNKAFTEWGEIFPNAACVVSIIDRLVHHSDIINIDADSYRLKEAKVKQQQKSKKNKLESTGETRRTLPSLVS